MYSTYFSVQSNKSVSINVRYTEFELGCKLSTKKHPKNCSLFY